MGSLWSDAGIWFRGKQLFLGVRWVFPLENALSRKKKACFTVIVVPNGSPDARSPGGPVGDGDLGHVLCEWAALWGCVLTLCMCMAKPTAAPLPPEWAVLVTLLFSLQAQPWAPSSLTLLTLGVSTNEPPAACWEWGRGVQESGSVGVMSSQACLLPLATLKTIEESCAATDRSCQLINM